MEEKSGGEGGGAGACVHAPGGGVVVQGLESVGGHLNGDVCIEEGLYILWMVRSEWFMDGEG